MRSYLVEDLLPEQVELIRQQLKAKGLAGGLEDIFYLPLPAEQLSDEQRAHAGECGPHICVLELVDQTCLKLELLVRAQGKLRCSCIVYATPAQREYIIEFLDAFIRQLDIAV